MNKRLRRFITSFFLILTLLLQNFLFLVNPVYAFTNTWDFSTASDYTYDNTKIEFSLGQAQLKMASSWYSASWIKRKAITIDNSGNGSTLTNYQVKVDVAYDTDMQADFDDIRFTSSNGTTIISHWLEAKTDLISATFWVKVPNIAASTTTTIYMYYGNAGASSASSGSGTFISFDDFDDNTLVPPLEVWTHQAVDSTSNLTECAVFRNGKVYASKQVNGLYIFNQTTGAVISNYLTSTNLNSSPIVDGSGYIFIYSNDDSLYKIAESDGSIAASVAVNDIDIESTGWDTDNNRLIVPYTNTVKAYNMSDLSEAWSSLAQGSEYVNGGSQAAPLVVGNYVYVKSASPSYLFKLNKATGAQVDRTVDLGTQDVGSYSSPIYDPDHDYIYVIGGQGQLHAIDAATMDIVWSKTLGSGMTNPRQQYSPVYHNNQVYVALREDNTSTGDISKIFALDYADGDILWTNTYPYDNYMAVSNFVVTDTHLIVAGHSADDLVSGSSFYFTKGGELMVIDITDGSTDYVVPLRKGGTSCALSNANNGQLFVSEHWGRAQLLDLGSGASTDSLHWKGNSYHNGYIGDKLTVDTSLLGAVTENTAWATAGTPTLSGRILTLNNTGYVQANLARSNVAVRTLAKFSTPVATSLLGFLQNPATGGGNDLGFFGTDSTSDVRTISQITCCATVTDLDAAYTGSYHTFEARWKTGELKTYVDNILKNTHTTNITTNRLPLSIASYGSTTLDVDWILMRKYSDPEPSNSFGSEVTLYDTTNQSVNPKSSVAQAFTSLSGFSETATKNGGEIKYQISNDSGSTWYWYNSGWISTSSGYTEANTASEINSNISTFPVGSKSFPFKAYLHSDGTQLVQLDSIDLSFEAATYYVDNTITDTHVASATPDCTNYDPTPGHYTCSGGSVSAYASIADINAGSFSGNDQILFKSGETWNETLSPYQSGTSGHSITFGKYGSGDLPKIAQIYLNTSNGSAEYLTFQDLEIANSSAANSVSIIGLNNFVLQRLSVHDCSTDSCDGLYIDSDAANITIQNSNIYNNKSHGIWAVAGDGLLIQDNNIYSNGTNGISATAQVTNGTAIIQRNNVYSNTDYGIATAPGLAGATYIRYNSSHDNGASGIYFHGTSASHNIYVEYNLLYNHTSGGNAGILTGDDITGLNNCYAYNNVFMNNNRSILQSGGGALTLKNNIFYSAINQHLYIMPTGGGAFTSDYNILIGSGNVVYVRKDSANKAFAEWQSYNSNAYDQHSSQSDPLFVSTSTPDFHLQSSSPAINTGVDVGLTIDYDGGTVPAGAAPDIGAYEYGSEMSTPENIWFFFPIFMALPKLLFILQNKNGRKRLWLLTLKRK